MKQTTPPILKEGETADFDGQFWTVTPNPEPEPVPEQESKPFPRWTQWRSASLPDFKKILDALHAVDPVLVALFPTMFAQLPSGLPELVVFWNDAISGIDPTPLTVIFERLAQLMVDFDIPLSMDELGRLTARYEVIG